MATQLNSNPQMGFQESVIVDDALEGALDKRLQAKDARAEAQAAFDTADEKAREKVASRELPPGVHRCGQHKITVSVIEQEEKEISFTRSAKRETKVSFGLFQE